MKTRLLITSIILCGCAHFLMGQDTITQEMMYKTSVRLLSNPSFNFNGVLYEVKDSSISISSQRLKDYYSGNVETFRFPVDNLKVIYIQKPGNGRRGTLKGAAYGVALGILFGLVNGSQTILTPGGDILLGATCGLVVGAPTGFIVGIIAGHKRTPINGSMDEFNLNKDQLKEYAIKK